MNLRLLLATAIPLWMTVPCSFGEAPTRAELRELLKKAADWEVPLPPENAVLVKVWAYSFSGGDGPSHDRYWLGFLDSQNQGHILHGFDEREISAGRDIKAAHHPIDLSDLAAPPRVTTNSWLITGIQLLRRGDKEAGTALIEHSLKQDAGNRGSLFHIPANQPAVITLARNCLADAINDITGPNPDFAQILRRIERLRQDQAELIPITDWTVAGLKEAINYPQPPPGSIEAVIEEYLKCGAIHGATAPRQAGMSPAEQALVLKGFEAIPAIVQQIGSRRTTNHLMQGSNDSPGFPMGAGTVLKHYLQEFANSESGSDWLEVKKEPPFAKQAIQAWWQEASEMGEKAYVEKQILRPKRILRQNPKNEAEVVLGEKLLLIQKTRYPEQLPDTYRRLLKTKTPSYPVAKALSEPAALPQELKIALLDEGIATGKPEHRNSALLVLGGLDQAAAEVRLLKLLNDSPATAEGTYMMDQNANLGHFVATSRDPKTWDAFHNLLTRADLGMKMELIANCPPKRDAPPEVLASFYQIYERFGRDETLRDKSSSEKFKGARAVFPHDRITMGNFVHMMFANWLEFPLKEPEGENEEEWAAYRAKVKQRLDESRKPRPPEAK